MDQTVAEASEQYETARHALLNNEADLDVLWRVVIAADNLAKVVAWWESD